MVVFKVELLRPPDSSFLRENSFLSPDTLGQFKVQPRVFSYSQKPQIQVCYQSDLFVGIKPQINTDILAEMCLHAI